MKNLQRVSLSIPFAALLALSVGLPSCAAARDRGGSVFDGSWSLVVETTRGNCPAAVRAGVLILAGQVSADDQSYQAYGAVGRDGVIKVTVASGNRSASGSGRLSQNAGGGRWRTATGECSGQWTAERRNW